VLHEALVDVDLLYQLLEDDEEQRDEPQQHELYKLTEMSHRYSLTGRQAYRDAQRQSTRR
jgi:hypothetical protein